MNTKKHSHLRTRFHGVCKRCEDTEVCSVSGSLIQRWCEHSHLAGTVSKFIHLDSCQRGGDLVAQTGSLHSAGPRLACLYLILFNSSSQYIIDGRTDSGQLWKATETAQFLSFHFNVKPTGHRSHFNMLSDRKKNNKSNTCTMNIF